MYQRRWGLLTHLQSSQVAPSVAGGLLTFVPIVTSFVASTTLLPYFVWKSTLLNNEGCTERACTMYKGWCKSFQRNLTFCVVHLTVLFKLWLYPIIRRIWLAHFATNVFIKEGLTEVVDLWLKFCTNFIIGDCKHVDIAWKHTCFEFSTQGIWKRGDLRWLSCWCNWYYRVIGVDILKDYFAPNHCNSYPPLITVWLHNTCEGDFENYFGVKMVKLTRLVNDKD